MNNETLSSATPTFDPQCPVAALRQVIEEQRSGLLRPEPPAWFHLLSKLLGVKLNPNLVENKFFLLFSAKNLNEFLAQAHFDMEQSKIHITEQYPTLLHATYLAMSHPEKAARTQSALKTKQPTDNLSALILWLRALNSCKPFYEKRLIHSHHLDLKNINVFFRFLLIDETLPQTSMSTPQPIPLLQGASDPST